MYLKRWVSNTGHLYAYRTLVPHDKVPLWKRVTPRGVAYRSHLYTRIAAGKETDDFERWLAREFEEPAEAPLRKAAQDERMSPEDWQRLIAFVAAQDVRTPARLLENIRRWDSTLPEIMDSTLQETIKALRNPEDAGKLGGTAQKENDVELPARVRTRFEPGKEVGELGVEIVLGRGLWIWSMKQTLTSTAKVLFKHKWTIFRAPPGVQWITSDNPVLRLNFDSESKYNFKGGWGNPGSEIIFPLSPDRLLYTQVGQRPPMRGAVMSAGQARLLRRFLAQHAHRTIISCQPDNEVPLLRPRFVDHDAFQRERLEWEAWHQEQSAAEQKLMNGEP